MPDTQTQSKFGGAGVLAALVASSALAYFWPVFTETIDPFRLNPNGLSGLVVVTMFCLGLVVRQDELTELRQRPLTVFLGVVVQCTAMPVLAWLVVRTLGLEGNLAYGVLLCGCVPGAMASNVLTMTARGNVSYSVSLTSVATLLSPVTVPAALMVVAGLETGSEVFKPAKMAVTLLLTVVVPVIAGYWAKRLSSFMRNHAPLLAPPVATVALLWIIASVVAGNRDRLSQVAISLLAGLLVMNVLGYVSGYTVGRVTRMPEAMRRALTLEVGMQNAGLGTMLAATLLGADSAAQIPTAAYTFGCMLTGTVLAAAWAGRGNVG
ncbi:bile acid:sodium symporter family protein [Stieleria mannarensis]|uniref:bile acid:sodium symporter family protein n=1 Tax=Stieleria mannarensis TaxID=2755585 RepID=UPI001603B4D2|nr:bile acid:sodium symporter family protein [Rhodopirellula sp. JC639]